MGAFTALSDAMLYAWSPRDAAYMAVFLVVLVFVFAFVIGEWWQVEAVGDVCMCGWWGNMGGRHACKCM